MAIVFCLVIVRKGERLPAGIRCIDRGGECPAREGWMAYGRVNGVCDPKCGILVA